MAVGRNDPCPCGSGKRYKQCHGGLGAMPAPPAAPPPAVLAAMNAALAHQQQGEFADADRMYALALALAPDNFDALHMQGVVAYQRREFHRAEALIRRAIAINPRVETAHHNLTLVLQAHALESELCRAMLPALADWCAPGAPARAAATHVITFDAIDNEMLRHYRAAFERALAAEPGVRIWRQQRDGALQAGRDAAPDAQPRDGTFVFVGAGVAPGPWYREARPAAAVIVCHEAAPCAVYDQVRAVSHELAHGVHLWFTGEAVAREAVLRGGCGDAAALAAWLRQAAADRT
ncbi:MAG: SEC-C domain-containing protein [Burkholderiales bacterium]|nr:SEC-C domain-containing protein [Burkholderiales bacterium]